MRILVILICFLGLPTLLFAQKSTSEKDQIEKKLKFYYGRVLEFRKLNDSDSALYYNDLLLEATPEIADALIIRYYQKVETYLHFSKTAEAYALALKVKKKYCQSDLYCDGCNYINGFLVEMMILIEDFEKALVYQNENCQVIRDPNWYYKKAQIQLKIGLQRDAIKTMNQGIQDLRKFDNSRIKCYNNAGLLFRDLNMYQEALDYYEKAIIGIQKTGQNKQLISTIYGNMGYCYHKLERYESAYIYLEKDVKGSLIYNNWDSYSLAMLDLMMLDSLTNNYESVIRRGQEVLQHKEIEYSRNTLSKLYLKLSQAYEKLGDRDSALEFHKKYADGLKVEEARINLLKQSFLKVNANNAIDLLESKLELEESLREKQLYSIEQREMRAKFWNLTILICSVFLIILVVLSVMRYRSNLRKKNEMNKIQLDLAKKEQVILEMKVEKEKESIRELCLELTLKSDFAQNLSNKIAELKDVPSSSKNEIELFVNNELLLKTNRAKLSDLIEQTGERFYGEIEKKHPNLTSNDLELSLMIQLKLTNKEIAIKKNITPASVKIAKNRLKKKMDLSADDDLNSYMEQFVQPDLRS